VQLVLTPMGCTGLTLVLIPRILVYLALSLVYAWAQTGLNSTLRPTLQ
jgi:hypothetical protein